MPDVVAAICHMRSDEERRDQALSWARPDPAFFASGACHVLAYRFLRRQRVGSFHIVLLQPHDGLPGTHVFATDGEWAFDFNGWVPEAALLAASVGACRERWPAWDVDRIDIDPAVGLEEFCRTWAHRPPDGFPGDVEERADRYLQTMQFADAERLRELLDPADVAPLGNAPAISDERGRRRCRVGAPAPRAAPRADS